MSFMKPREQVGMVPNTIKQLTRECKDTQRKTLLDKNSKSGRQVLNCLESSQKLLIRSIKRILGDREKKLLNRGRH